MRLSADIQDMHQSATMATIISIPLRGNQDMLLGNDPQRPYWGAA
ncbi:hypothetical protein [Xanthomonas oryzae]|uniref:Uncharacterized protein n=1 Tax=Xanthomonas oryzae pv. oryzae (strain PXO99A) TaxID=360094 RepID=A0A0K0GG83_XANOP|nr:hypothetical protein [Xanthomonas oryzae]ACD57039.1 hypothetical protein PXO_03835 [Xanthomonas oryzae pv. oryzae PXO99A]